MDMVPPLVPSPLTQITSPAEDRPLEPEAKALLGVTHQVPLLYQDRPGPGYEQNRTVSQPGRAFYTKRARENHLEKKIQVRRVLRALLSPPRGGHRKLCNGMPCGNG